MPSEATHDLSDHDGPIRIGVLSDTHGALAQHVLERLQGSDVILHAGDVMGQHVLDELASITAQVIAVSGNNDPGFTYDQERLPDLVHLKLPGGDISLLHGHQFGHHSPSHNSMRNAFSSSRTIIYGHSHKLVYDCDASPSLLNPGAAGNTRTHGGASCAIIVADHCGEWETSLYREA